MFIILSIYSKNLNSLTAFLKVLHKLRVNKTFKLKFYIIQSHQKKKFSFFSTLRSPHVNKKSQEQFDYHLYRKKLKIKVSQLTKFLTVLKIIKTVIFPDLKVKIGFKVNCKPTRGMSRSNLDFNKFKLKFSKKKLKYLKSEKSVSNPVVCAPLALLDVSGEILIKNLVKRLDSSVGRAKD